MAADSARAARLTWLSRGLLVLAALASVATAGILIFVGYLVVGAYSGYNNPTSVAGLLFPVAVGIFIIAAVPAGLLTAALWLLRGWVSRGARTASAGAAATGADGGGGGEGIDTSAGAEDRSQPSLSSRGAGPGPITPDGCAVEFYALLVPGPEPGIVHAAAPSPGASVLELGAGTGRISDALAALGHPVTAVDESPEMLAHVRAAAPVRARIEELALPERFGVVLLPSHLVNTPDEPVRAAFLRTCARHLAPGGCVVIQQHPPAWFDEVAESETERDGVVFRLKNVSQPVPGLVSATVEYQAGERVWTQTFTTARLDEPALRAELAGAGLAFDRYLTYDRQWLRAVAADRESAR